MKSDSTNAILHDLESFRQMGSVLYIAAHPDDENTLLLAYLTRGRHYRTAYLSLTRGDGGQNVIAPDLGEKLGVARTQELLAARQIDGARQYFSRAIDFGFSKNYLETLTIWNKQELLSDIVHVIRQFRPDILITRFSPSPGGTHGHHTTSTMLAMEAFKLAGDAKAFPQKGLEPWQPKRILWNTSTFQKDKIIGTPALKIAVNGNDPISGETFVDIAERSRGMHKTQGFDTFKMPDVKDGARLESFQFIDGEPATKDIMEGIDTSWNRIPGGGEIEKSANDIIKQFDPNDASASVPALLRLRKELVSLSSNDPVVKEKQILLDRILQECLGLKVETTTAQAEIVPGEELELHYITSISSKIPVRWIGVNYPTINKEVKKNMDLHAGAPSVWDTRETLPRTTLLTQPWWLRSEGSPGMFHTDDAKLIGTPENAAAFPIENVFEIEGQTLVILDEPVYLASAGSEKQKRHRLNIIPPVSLRFLSEVGLFKPGNTRPVEIEITASRINSAGTVKLEVPSEWKVRPAKQTFHLEKIGEKAQFKFIVTAPLKSTTAKIIASAEMHNVRYSNQRQEINYRHIPPQLLQPPATMKVVSLDLQKQGHIVGYLPGAGDSMPEDLREMGYQVQVLDDANLTLAQLDGLDAVVLGVRALNVRNNMTAAMPILFEYIKNGGTVIVQYNRSDGLKTKDIAPYDLHISSDRVTDENAVITLLDPENQVLNKPNKITGADFDHWVQERGLYFPNEWDEHFTPILACNDAGEKPLKGALLVAPYGKGYFIYTGLAFFRQLPAGVPGAYRLLANLISIGK